MLEDFVFTCVLLNVSFIYIHNNKTFDFMCFNSIKTAIVGGSGYLGGEDFIKIL